MKSLLNRLQRLRHNRTAQGTVWVLGARLLRTFLQSAYFLLVARALGAQQYGTFIGVTALTKVLLPFATWGAAQVLTKQVARDRNRFPQAWGNALYLVTTFSLLSFALLIPTSEIILPNVAALGLWVSIGIAELFFSRVLDVALKAFLAVDLAHRNAQLHVLLSINSVLAALSLSLFIPEPTALIWGQFYLVSRVVTAAIALLLVWRDIGPPRLALKQIHPELTQGFYFAVDLSAQSFSADLDKTMLARMATLQATGIYGAAYRIIDVAMAPVLSLMAVSYAKFFKQGADGIQGSLKLAKRLVPLAGSYGAIASVGLWLTAPLVPYVLGPEYEPAIAALRWLSPILLFKSLQYFAADTLTGAGLQGHRTLLQVVMAVFNGLGNAWLIPLYSWKGAAWASLATDGLLTLSLWGLVAFFYNRSNRIESCKA